MKDIKLDQLLRNWRALGKNSVIDDLESDHPGLTALLITSGSQYHDPKLRLRVTDCNEIANRLMDRRIELFQKPNENARRHIRIMADNLRALAIMLDIEGDGNPDAATTRMISELRGTANRLRDIVL